MARVAYGLRKARRHLRLTAFVARIGTDGRARSDIWVRGGTMSLLPYHSLFSLDSLSHISRLLTSELPAGAQPSVSKPLDARGATPGYRAAVRPRQDGRWTPAPPLPHNKTDTYVEVLQDETVEGGQRTRGCPTTRPASSSLCDEAAVSGTENHDHYGAAAAPGGSSSMLD
ncbi:hypothetical protein OsI_03693 [Oryza sativa Indica Group]|uniref:Uncharacterized protein n=1 Tax=Oryza sativa subsp. indica TaxID=39946 RepID=B8A9D8_ORYSI|nr:hypothetical protein OsI_03693 [Oryza sativa Indica Group]